MASPRKVMIPAAALLLIGLGALFMLELFKARELRRTSLLELEERQQKLDQERDKRLLLELENDALKARLDQAPAADAELLDRVQALGQEQTRLAKLAKRLAEDKREAMELAEERQAQLRALQLNLLKPGRPRDELAPLLEIEPELKQKFGPWFALWSKDLPGFRLEVFIREGERNMEDLVWPLDARDDQDEDDRERMKLCVWSPDRNKGACPHWCLGEADSCVMVVDLDKKQLKRVSFCGTPCSFDEAHWIDNDRFAVLGAINEFIDLTADPDTIWLAEISIYNLESGKLTAFQGPPLGSRTFAEDYRKFRKARQNAWGMK